MLLLRLTKMYCNCTDYAERAAASASGGSWKARARFNGGKAPVGQRIFVANLSMYGNFPDEAHTHKCKELRGGTDVLAGGS